MLEPTTIQEAKDMVKWAFDLSEELQQLVLVRSVTRICHGRSNVTLGEMPSQPISPSPISEWDRLVAVNWFKEAHLAKIDQAKETFENFPFNSYEGPAELDLLIVTCGTGWLYSREAVETLGLKESVGILKIGTTWPLPEKFITKYLAKANKVLVVEEVDPFLEQNIAQIIAYNPQLNVELVGRHGHVILPRSGELSPNIVRNALANLTKTSYQAPRKEVIPSEETVVIPPRDLTFCAGCCKCQYKNVRKVENNYVQKIS